MSSKPQHKTRRLEKPIKKFQVFFFKRIVLEPDTEFSIKDAFEWTFPFYNDKKLNKHSKKTQLKMFKNSLDLRSISWFSDVVERSLLITDVRRFYIFKRMPNFVVLGLESSIHADGQMIRHLVTLKVPKADNLAVLCDHIEQSDVNVVGHRSNENESSHASPLTPYNDGLVNQAESVPAMVDECRIVPVERAPRSHQKQSRPSSSSSSSSSNGHGLGLKEVDGPSWREEVTFISYDPLHGNTIDEKGSIYLYSAQQLRPDYSAIYNSSLYSVSPSSSSSSSSSSERRFKHYSGKAIAL